MAYRDDILATPGLVSYWRLNDASGFLTDAKATNAASAFGGVTRQVAGLLSGDPDTAVRGDGAVGTYINVPHHVSLNATDALTFECWVLLESYVSGRVILNRGSEWLYQTVNNAYRWRVVDSGGTTRLCTAANNSIVVGTRQHLVGVFDRTNAKMELYVDGVLSGSLTIPTNWGVETVTAPFIMLSQSSGVAGMVGTLDEVAYYTTALTAAQVQAHYQAGSGGGAYFDAATGRVVIAGSSTDNLRRSGGRAGALALSGSNIDNWSTPKSYIDTVTGSLKLSGSCVDGFHGAMSNSDAPSGRMVLSGSVTSTRESVGWASIVRELPPLRHHVDAIATNGRHYRWANDEPDAENVPGNLRWSSTVPGGYETMDTVLARKPGVNYNDLERLSTLKVVRAGGGSVVGEYRLERTPQVSGDQMSISPSAVGWQAHMDDQKGVSIVFIDRELSPWVGANSQRRLAELTGLNDPIDASSTSGDDGLPSLKMALQGAWSRRANCEAYYYFPSGDAASRVKFDYQVSTPVNFSGDANWIADMYASVSDGYSGFSQLTPNDWMAAASGSVNGNASALAYANRRALMLRLYYNGAGGSDGVQYEVFLRNLRVFGNHGLQIRGTTAGKEGFIASDMIAYALRKWAPLLKVAPPPPIPPSGQPYQPPNTEWIQPTDFIIPQAKFLDTTVGEMTKQLTRFGLEDYAVWNDKIFYLMPRNGNPLARKWRARIGPAKFEETGKQVDRLWESIIVEFTDVDGSTRTVGPPGSGCDVETAYLKDTDPENPANKLGMTRRDKLVMGTSTFNGAIEVGRRFLEEQKLIDRSGRAVLVGFVEDNHGVLWPYSEVQAGDILTFVDANDTSYRRIVRADHDESSKAAAVDLDAPPEGLQAVLERLQVVLVPLGL